MVVDAPIASGAVNGVAVAAVSWYSTDTDLVGPLDPAPPHPVIASSADNANANFIVAKPPSALFSSRGVTSATLVT